MPDISSDEPQLNGFPSLGIKLLQFISDNPGRSQKQFEEARKAEVPHRYELGRCIGNGSYGSVYQAFDRVTNQNVAVKKVMKSFETMKSSLNSSLK